MDVTAWAKAANPGERVVYARRSLDDIYLSRDTAPFASAQRAHAEGLVFLAQRRRPGGFDYEATRISPWVARKLGLAGHERFEHLTLNRQAQATVRVESTPKRRYAKGEGW